MIRQCTEADVPEIFEVINDAAEAYRGRIPKDRWREPYMRAAHVRSEVASGVQFWAVEQDGMLLGVMGIQDCGAVTLIRHAYVRTDYRRQGVGSLLLKHLERLTGKPILIGTWAAATWAIDFYRKHGYRVLDRDQTVFVLEKYWTIPARQTEASVVLAGPTWEPDEEMKARGLDGSGSA